MFETLSERLNQTIKNLTGRGRLTEENIQQALREVRIALLEADVSLPIVKQFVEKIKLQALGEQVISSITPGQALIKIVHDELTFTLGEAHAELNLQAQPPLIILMAGLQGSGKTTTSAKLAQFIKTRLKKSILISSIDIYRPAAIQQLEILAQQIDVEFYPTNIQQTPVKTAQDVVSYAKRKGIEVVILDTAGRLHIDEEMMSEIKQIHTLIQPTETLFIVDGMTGQDAANTAKAFNDAVPLTGIILTKLDGDARGGAALSIWGTIHKPIKFIGTGEKIDAFEPFYPNRMASRILDMGDIISLVEEAEKKIDQKKAEKIAKKLKKGKGFDLEDFLDQLDQMTNMGGISGLLSKLPGVGALPQAVKNQVNDKLFTSMKAIIQSMTAKERRFPAIINGSRKRRIALGSGTQIQDVNRLLKQFIQMQKMMKKINKSGGMMKMMRNLKGIMPSGKFPSTEG